MRLRAASGGAQSLDTLLRRMYREYPLSGPGYTSAQLEEEASRLAGAMRPGTNCADAPITRRGEPGWFLNQLPPGFALLVFAPDAPVAAVTAGDVTASVVCVGRDFSDAQGLLAQRYDARPGTVYLLRPDQHVAARWRSFDPVRIRAAIARACTMEPS